MAADNSKKEVSKLRRIVLTSLHMVVLGAAVLLILIITRDIFENISFLVDPQYLRFQFWICVIFMIDIVIDCIFGDHNWRVITMNIIFFFLCIPIVNIIDYLGLHVSGEMLFLLRLLPMLRAAYIIVQVTGTIHSDKVSSLFRAYITLFVVVVYFSSLMFYVEEHSVNAGVDTYWSALWWTIMTLTTAGCYITEVTTVGKILSVVLSGGGLILFPVFTVYVANAVSGSSSSDSSSSDNSDNNDSDKKDTESTAQDGNNTNFADNNGSQSEVQSAQ
ncbi:MAG: potassium channel family protein [Muribaculaceae bacterium]|nr:potassium channel family protein [Muribaculaceae bacterium]MDE6702512.1 potassium channel family protein [Muribaculaceae bacterium]